MLMLSLFLYTFGLVITLGATAMAAWSDVCRFRIPNVVSVLVLAGFAVAYVGASLVPGVDVVPIFQTLLSHGAAFVLVFVLTLILFATHSIGAGDAKFASALALWVGLQGVALFIFYMSLIGGVMGIATLAVKRWKPFGAVPEGSWLAAAQGGQNRLPYGLAIALGFVLVAGAMGYFNITELTKLVENVQ